MKTKQLILCAFFAAITAVLSQIAIPIGPVPINLATFAVFCSGIFLGAKYGAISQTLYVLLGAIGVPVFAFLTGGIGIITGPTGGFIVGYILAAGLIGLIVDRFGIRLHTLVLAMIAGAGCYFSLGAAWYMQLTNTGLIATLMVCVVPFLIGDALKIAVAVLLAKRLYPVLRSEAIGARSNV